MRQLHFVGIDAASGHVVLATSDALEKFELAVDAALREAVGGAPSTSATETTGGSGPSSSSGEARISPREIQMRVRSGETPAQIAAECGSGVDWVMRFAGPVLAERTRIADEARRAKARRSTTEGQIVVFGEAVEERFAAHGIDPADVTWDAHRREDGQWIITAHWVGGQAERTAEWAFQLSGRMVAPVDDTAADLLSDRPIRPLFPAPEPVSPPALSLAPPLAPGIVAFPVMADTHTGPLPRADEVFDQDRFGDDAPGTPAAPQAPAPARPAAPAPAASAHLPVPPAAATTQPPAAEQPEFEEPVLPMHVPDAPDVTTRIPKVSAARAQSEEERAARSAIPSWDDILLGVRRKRD